MKILKTLFILLLFVAAVPSQGQTADEIINNYLENIGGADALNNIESVKMTASANAQGMEIPVTILQEKGGNQLIKINFQGQEIVQLAFDGETMWGTNFMTQEAEKMDSEQTENMKRNANLFPDPFLNYKDNGYSVEYMGEETKEGTETYKIKLTMNPQLADGKEVPNVVFYYFEKENFVPIMSESEIPSGPTAGQMSVNTMSDYQEVDGIYFPFDMGIGGQSITIESIEINPEIDKSVFAFPATEDTDDND